jgi:hypothetical protein
MSWRSRHRTGMDADRPWPWAGRCPGPDRRGRARAVAAHQRRGWQQRQTVLRLDPGAAVALGLARQRGGLAAGPPHGERPWGAGLLRVLRAGRHPAGDAGAGGGLPLAGRGGIRAGQRRGRAGPLLGPPVSGLVPARHPGDDRAGVPGRHPRPGHRPDHRGRGAVVVTALGVLITLTVAELRRLLARLVWRPPVDPALTLGWSLWRRRYQATARRAHYQQQRRKLRL